MGNPEQRALGQLGVAEQVEAGEKVRHLPKHGGPRAWKFTPDLALL